MLVHGKGIACLLKINNPVASARAKRLVCRCHGQVTVVVLGEIGGMGTGVTAGLVIVVPFQIQPMSQAPMNSTSSNPAGGCQLLAAVTASHMIELTTTPVALSTRKFAIALLN